MRPGLDGRRLLITGGGQGVGAAVARQAARVGAACIAISGRDAAKAEGVLSDLRDAGAEAAFFARDLAQPGAPEALHAEAADWAGGLDGLANCAGLTDRAALVDGTLETWERLFAVNARAPYFLMQAFVRARMAAGAPGSVVNIASMNAHCGAPELAIYAATKGALVTLTKNAAHAHLADRIRVNAINMGWAATEGERRMRAETLGEGAGWVDAAARARPLGRLLEAEEVARLAVYLLSDASGLQTGTAVDLEQHVVGALP